MKHKTKETPDKKEESSSESYELLTPQFIGRVTLSLEQSALLGAGQRVQVSFTPQGQSLGDFLFSRFQRWCRDKVRRMRNAWST